MDQMFSDLMSKMGQPQGAPFTASSGPYTSTNAFGNSFGNAFSGQSANGFGNMKSASNAAAAAVNAKGGNPGGLKGLFGNIAGGAKNAWSNVKAGKGIVPSFAKEANIGAGVTAALNAIQGISNYQAAAQDTDDLVAEILQSAASNPNIRYDLSSDQLQTLRKLQNGTYDTSGDFELSHLLGNLGETAAGAGIGFLTGGPLGAVLGGAGGLVNGISSGMVGNQEQITADLQGLYEALYESEMNAKAMRRDAAMQRYANSLYY
jgi:hypothetical protein